MVSLLRYLKGGCKTHVRLFERWMIDWWKWGVHSQCDGTGVAVWWCRMAGISPHYSMENAREVSAEHWKCTHYCWTQINSLAPGRFKWNFGLAIFKLTLVTDGWVISCEIPLSRMSLYLTDDKSTLVQVMAWCRQATSHYLSQCWPRSMPPYRVPRPQWVKDKKCAKYTRYISYVLT